MINWSEILSNGLWLAGLALILAAASYEAALHRGRRSRWVLWRDLARSPAAHLGALLFCAGMALTSGSTLEGALWGLLGLYSAYELARSLLQGNRTRLTLITESGGVRPARSPTGRAAEWIVKRELIWLALLSPAFIFPGSSYALALLGVPLLWVARWIARRRFLPVTPLDLPLALMALMLLVGLYATFDIGFSLVKIAGLIYGIALFYAIVEWAQGGKRIGWTLALYVVAGIALAFVGLIGTEWANKLPVLKQIADYFPGVVRGLPGAESGINPNELGGALLWVVPLQISLLGWSLTTGLHASPRWWALRAGLLFTSVAGCGTLLLTQSRGALVGFLVACALLAVVVLWRFKWALLALVLLGGGALAYVGPQRVSDKLAESYGLGFSATDGVRSIRQRVEIWSRAIYGIEDFPFTGVGMNAFRKVIPVLYPMMPVGEGTETGEEIAHAHNQFLQAALDLGLPGLVAYLAIWCLIPALAVAAWRGSKSTLHRAATAGAGTGLLAFFVFALTDTVVLGAKPGPFFWGLLGILTALWWDAHRSGNTPELPVEQEQDKIEAEARDARQGVQNIATGQEEEQPVLVEV